MQRHAQNFDPVVEIARVHLDSQVTTKVLCSPSDHPVHPPPPLPTTSVITPPCLLIMLEA